MHIGRRYHSYYGTNKNLNPTDEVGTISHACVILHQGFKLRSCVKTEQDRLDLHHEIFLLLLNRELHKAPLSHPQRILDIGTGTGIWAIDMADKYPMAEVVGTDLRYFNIISVDKAHN